MVKSARHPPAPDAARAPVAHRPAAVATKRKSGGATPTNKALYARVKAEAKRKFDVWPSAYASGWLTKEYKRRGGKYA